MSYPYIQQPRPEQIRALKKIYKAKNVLVVGDMGVGKTKIGVDFIANMVYHKKISRAVIVCPLEALDVWLNEINHLPPGIVTHSLYIKGETPNWKSNIILVNYDYVSPRKKKNPNVNSRKKKIIDKKVLLKLLDFRPEVTIIDEGHKIKKPSARRSKAIHQLGAISKYTIDLTGTPTGNKKILDLWSQYKFIKRDLLDPTYNEHKERYGRWRGFGRFTLIGTRNIPHLMKKIKPHLIRIKKRDLPPQNFIPYKVDMPSSAKSIYTQMEEDFVAYVQGQDVVASIALTKMMKLSQIAGGHIKNEKKENLDVHRAKLNTLRELQEEFTEAGVKHLVIFARFIWELDEIKKLMQSCGWYVHRVRGRVLQPDLDRFNRDGGVMLCQTASGSGSNNFQAANYTVFYSTDYSVINFQQALSRTHRTGQTKPTFYYFLQSKGTIDSRIYRLLQNNQEAADNFKQLAEEITEDDNSGRY